MQRWTALHRAQQNSRLRGGCFRLRYLYCYGCGNFSRRHGVERGEAHRYPGLIFTVTASPEACNFPAKHARCSNLLRSRQVLEFLALRSHLREHSVKFDPKRNTCSKMEHAETLESPAVSAITSCYSVVYLRQPKWPARCICVGHEQHITKLERTEAVRFPLDDRCAAHSARGWFLSCTGSPQCNGAASHQRHRRSDTAGAAKCASNAAQC